VTPALPLGADGSIFQRINAGQAGIDAYAAAISDVYQDLFGEGSFTGKGIYDVDAFEAAMAGRVPENTLLSHDLFEGNLARAGLVSDIEVVEDFPARTDVAARRQHRWVRGDWQLVPFLVGRHGGTMSALGRWKIIDNLRRSLTAPLTLVALVAGWFLPLPLAAGWTGAVLAMMALPHLLPLPFVLLPGRAGITARSHATALVADARDAAWQVVLAVVLLPDTAARMGDAILRTAWRLCRSHRNLLEWTTAAQISLGGRPSLAGLARAMAPGVGLGLVAAGAPLAANPTLWPLILPFAVLWLAAPAIAHRISRPEAEHRALPLTQAQAQDLRLIGRRTWRYFETFVTATDNFLPPDNFQETPVPVVARRTSPTNIGLYLLATTAARDLGWVGLSEAVERLEQTLATLQRMPRFRGHIHNWHATDDLHVMAPAYVSSVDSGNLAGHLIAVAQACAAWRVAAGEGDLRAGVRDAILLAVGAPDADLDPVLADRLAQLTAGVDRGAHLAALMRLADLAAARAVEMADEGSDLRQWVEAARSCLASHARDLGPTLAPRLAALERQARAVATGMDFAFLLDPEKKLLSIGFSVETNALDRNCYDLLASEARLASLFAIAKGDVETRHWFRLGRSATPLGAGSALISWSGSMFEYLMPSLVMRAPAGSLLEETNRRIVVRQQDYAKAVGIPWGISESAYNARDLEMTYQYSNFGVPGLGLKRGLSESRVVAPYATALAAMVDPAGALRNFARLAGLGAVGRFGFYDAVDFSVQRLPTGSTQAIVRSFMAHHQGMTIAAIANVLMDGRLRARFHAEPMIQAVDLLLQERVPRDASEAPPRARDVATAATEPLLPPAVRRFPNPAAAAETAHLLSNGSYGVVLTPTGAGYSRWRGMAVTRWRDDPTTAQHGAFILLSDRKSGALWSAGLQPTGAGPDRHRVMFCDHHAAFTHEGDRLTTHTEVVVSAEDDAEARRVTLTNSGRQPRRIDVTSYAELVLAPLAADIAHPAFSKLFVVTDHMPELGAIIATRRRRSPSDPEVWAAHVAVVEGVESGSFQFETDRARFLGRCGSIGCAAMAHGPLSNTAGTVLDPIFALRRSVIVPPGGVARVTFWTTVADTPEALLDLVDRHRDAPAFDRAEALSWTQSQVQLRHLGITSAAAADFQRLGGMVLRPDPRLRAPRRQIEAGAGPQSGLWSMGISGDLPLVILRMNETEDMDALHQVVSAHAYWRARQLDVDLVILNDRASSYVQELQTAIDVAVRTAQATPRSDGHGGTMRGRIHVLRADLLSSETRGLLLAVARVVLTAGDGDIGRQIDGMAPVAAPPPRRPRHGPAAELPGDADDPPLEFFNGLGGFDKDGREYVTVLRDGQTTPAPWINVIANPGFGFQVSAEGGGFVWAENSRENQITPWSNDPITDPPGDAIYLHDLDSDALWTVTALPIRGQGRYTARHGFGYTRFDHRAHDIDAAMVQFVPPDDPVRITRLTLTNHGPRPRRISVTAYAEWVLGSSRGATLGHVITETDPASGAILARNTYATAFLGRIAFADFGAGTSSLTADRTEFLGHGGSMAAPAGIGATPLSGRTGPALDPCAALQRRLTLAPGETAEVVFLLGQAPSREAARDLIRRHRATDPEVTLTHVRHHWSDLLGTVQVTSPDRAMDILLNGWLLYQTLACRIWARAGFYQASGAYGFRDQLQDGMALTALRPEMTRAHLLRAASRQFAEGDVQHWWLPHSGQGVRTRISDDRVWLGYAVAQYVAVSGDAGVLDAQVPFLDGPALAPGVHDDFFLPGVSETSASLFEHCARGLDQAIALTGTNGMPLIGTGDWNDGMNRVGEGGAGTSVWLGWLLVATLNRMAPLADTRDPARAVRWRAHAASVTAAIEAEGWDGAWYRRGTYDDGTPLGSARSDECRIDSIAQSWAVLSGAAAPSRAARAMASMTEHLVRPDPGLALLFTPPFDRTDRDPGYIKGYPPGLRENGGQYSHAAMWAILAHCRLGNGDAAGALFALVNPINHALTPQDAARYKVEPYVVAADVYSTVPHDGRGGWTWYTGSAGWMYRAGIEGLLGLTRAGQTLTLDPCFPSGWPEVRMRLVHGGARLAITILNPGGSGYGVERADLDGADLPVADGRLTLTLPPPRASGDYRLTLALRPR
jgi:cyclic beta-1,2-glucan synthetase